MKINILLILVLMFVTTANSLVLILKGNNGIFRNRMLGCSLFFFSLGFLLNFLWFKAGYILMFPQFLKIDSPLLFLFGPFFYFYIRNSLFDLNGLQKYDWIHFLPAALHALDLIPFYIQSYETKHLYAQMVINDPSRLDIYGSGWIQAQVINSFRVVLNLAYFGYSLYLIYTIRPGFITGFNWGKIHNWLFMAVILMGFALFGHLGYHVILILQNQGLEFAFWIPGVFSSAVLLSFLILNTYMLFWPEIVHEYPGQEDVNMKPKSKNLNDITPTLMGIDDRVNETVPNSGSDFYANEFEDRLLKEKIQKVLEQDKLFLQNGLTVAQFAESLEISSRMVSQVLKKHFDLGFKELINQYRISYAKQKIEEGYLDQYTMDSLGLEVGFNSRTTFFNTFKKEFGCSPNDFWKGFQNPET